MDPMTTVLLPTNGGMFLYGALLVLVGLNYLKERSESPNVRRKEK